MTHKISSTSLVIRVMLKTTMRYIYVLTKITKIKKTNHLSVN